MSRKLGVGSSKRLHFGYHGTPQHLFFSFWRERRVAGSRQESVHNVQFVCEFSGTAGGGGELAFLGPTLSLSHTHLSLSLSILFSKFFARKRNRERLHIGVRVST